MSETKKKILPPEYNGDNFIEIFGSFRVLRIIMIVCLMLRRIADMTVIRLRLLLYVLTVHIKVNDLRNETSR